METKPELNRVQKILLRTTLVGPSPHLVARRRSASLSSSWVTPLLPCGSIVGESAVSPSSSNGATPIPLPIYHLGEINPGDAVRVADAEIESCAMGKKKRSLFAEGEDKVRKEGDF